MIQDATAKRSHLVLVRFSHVLSTRALPSGESAFRPSSTPSLPTEALLLPGGTFCCLHWKQGWGARLIENRMVLVEDIWSRTGTTWTQHRIVLDICAWLYIYRYVYIYMYNIYIYKWKYQTFSSIRPTRGHLLESLWVNPRLPSLHSRGQLFLSSKVEGTFEGSDGAIPRRNRGKVV